MSPTNSTHAKAQDPKAPESQDATPSLDQMSDAQLADLLAARQASKDARLSTVRAARLANVSKEDLYAVAVQAVTDGAERIDVSMHSGIKLATLTKLCYYADKGRLVNGRYVSETVAARRAFAREVADIIETPLPAKGDLTQHAVMRLDTLRELCEAEGVIFA